MMPEEIIPHSRPLISDSDLNAVNSVLKAGQISLGPKTREFENRLASFIGKKKAVAVSSGSAALHLALLALDIKTGDEVIIPSFVCSAVLNSVNYTGAAAVLVDIDPLTFNMSVEAAKRAITRKTKAIIVPHMFGCPAEIDKLSKLGIPVIEDCAQSVGANFKGQRAGSFGVISVFSFYATKVIAAAEGGMVLSDSEDLISRIKDRREYDHRDDYILRYNYKMTDIQAALGLSQLSSLEKLIDRRREIAARYFQELKNCDFSLPVRKEGKDHIYYRFVIRTKGASSEFIEKFHQKKVMCRRPIYIPLHVYLNLSGFPHTQEAWHKTISIPLYPSLREDEIEKIITVVKEVF